MRVLLLPEPTGHHIKQHQPQIPWKGVCPFQDITQIGAVATTVTLIDIYSLLTYYGGI